MRRNSLVIAVTAVLAAIPAAIAAEVSTDRTTMPDYCSNRDVNCVLPDNTGGRVVSGSASAARQSTTATITTDASAGFTQSGTGATSRTVVVPPVTGTTDMTTLVTPGGATTSRPAPTTTSAAPTHAGSTSDMTGTSGRNSTSKGSGSGSGGAGFSSSGTSSGTASGTTGSGGVGARGGR